MPPPLYPTSPGDILEVTARATLFGQTVLFTSHYRFDNTSPAADGPFTVTTALNEWNAVAGQLGFLESLQTPDITYNEIKAQIVYPTRRPYISQAPAAVAGTRAGDCKQPNDALFINKQSAVAARGRHGGWHVGAPPAADIAGGFFTPAYINAANTAAIVLAGPLAALLVGDHLWTPVIWSPQQPTTPSVILAARAQETVRTMHRRTVGLGI